MTEDTTREAVERIIRDAEAATDGCGGWYVGDYDTSGAVMEAGRVVADVPLIANAQRLVASVLTLREAVPTLRALLAEREELLAALRGMLDLYGTPGAVSERARAAIAKIERKHA